MARTQSREAGHSAKTTTDHDEIQRWAEERQGKPATVASTGRGGEEAGILRIDFPPYGNQGKLEDISWDEWFQKFDESGLQFLYQETTADGGQSTFNKLIAGGSSTSRSGGSKSSGKKSRAKTQSDGNGQGSRTRRVGANGGAHEDVDIDEEEDVDIDDEEDMTQARGTTGAASRKMPGGRQRSHSSSRSTGGFRQSQKRAGSGSSRASKSSRGGNSSRTSTSRGRISRKSSSSRSASSRGHSSTRSISSRNRMSGRSAATKKSTSSRGKHSSSARGRTRSRTHR